MSTQATKTVKLSWPAEAITYAKLVDSEHDFFRLYCTSDPPEYAPHFVIANRTRIRRLDERTFVMWYYHPHHEVRADVMHIHADDSYTLFASADEMVLKRISDFSPVIAIKNPNGLTFRPKIDGSNKTFKWNDRVRVNAAGIPQREVQ